MKKKYRKIVLIVALFIPTYIIAVPLGIIGVICEWIIDRTNDFQRWLEYKLKVQY